MKNFWLDRKGPKTTKINIWLGASITKDKEELLETVEVTVPKTTVSFMGQGVYGPVYDVQKYNPMTAISSELDGMLYHRRIGQALVKRNEQGHFCGIAFPQAVLKAQWTPGDGNKLFREENRGPNNKFMPFYVFHIRNETTSYNANCGYIDKTDWKAVKNEV